MYAIPNQSKPNAAQSVRRPIHGQGEIELWWKGELPLERHPTVLAKLAAMKQDDMWIVCECTGDQQNPPLFTLAFTSSASDSVTMRRLTKRSEHAASCPFKFEKREQSPGQTKEAGEQDRGGNARPASPPGFLERERASGLAARFDEDDDFEPAKANGERRDALARQLMWLLDSSGMQKMPKVSGAPIQMLRAAAEAMPLRGGLHLSDILYCKDAAWLGAWYEQAFKKCQAAGVQPQAVLVCPVVAASRKEQWVQFSSAGAAVPVSGRVSIYGDDNAGARYPMLMYAKILGGAGEAARIAKAYLHPILSEHHWMAVDSNLERDAMRTIRAALVPLQEKGITCTVDKPVYNWGETEARPDFVITAKKGTRAATLLVETMGTDDPEYLSRKRETVGRLAGFKVFQDLRYRANWDPDEKLKRFVIGYLLDQFGP